MGYVCAVEVNGSLALTGDAEYVPGLVSDIKLPLQELGAAAEDAVLRVQCAREAWTDICDAGFEAPAAMAAAELLAAERHLVRFDREVAVSAGVYRISYDERLYEAVRNAGLVFEATQEAIARLDITNADDAVTAVILIDRIGSVFAWLQETGEGEREEGELRAELAASASSFSAWLAELAEDNFAQFSAARAYAAELVEAWSPDHCRGSSEESEALAIMWYAVAGR